MYCIYIYIYIHTNLYNRNPSFRRYFLLQAPPLSKPDKKFAKSNIYLWLCIGYVFLNSDFLEVSHTQHNKLKNKPQINCILILFSPPYFSIIIILQLRR